MTKRTKRQTTIYKTSYHPNCSSCFYISPWYFIWFRYKTVFGNWCWFCLSCL